ncbi:hypothetical protein Patl1_04644 [Pistacia atlantica]|uniref:Uncharacterized protein n=1 Tax=Pistacia atlantica TaxID=434234 RepID=A0ACC1BWB8_9ROSI|nr:hypothetical protein Patl1_04644 [Pistacia atlantica]
MSICSLSESSCSSTKSWIVHGIVAGAAIAVAIGAGAYLGQSMKLRSGVRTWERSKLVTTLDNYVYWVEPLIEPEIVDGIVKALQAAPDAVFSTAVTSLKPEGKFNPRFPCILHLGIQSYDSKFLKIYPWLQPTPLQLGKDLEQLIVIENRYKMKVIKVDHEAHGVDTPEDVEKIESFMRERNLS